MSLQNESPPKKGQPVVAGYNIQDASRAHQIEKNDRHSSSTTVSSRSYPPTVASISTKATSTGTGGENAFNEDQTAQQNLAPTFPPPEPLILGFGAQFAHQLHQNALHTLQQQETDRRARMSEFHNAFISLGVRLPQHILEQVEDARCGVMTPDTVLDQLAAQHPQEDLETRWLRARDTWSTVTREMRTRLPDVDILRGWEDLEPLPNHD